MTMYPNSPKKVRRTPDGALEVAHRAFEIFCLISAPVSVSSDSIWVNSPVKVITYLVVEANLSCLGPLLYRLAENA